MKKNFRRFLKASDIYGYPISLNFRDSTKFRSKTGGFFSLFTGIVLIVLISKGAQSLILRENSQIQQQTVIQFNPDSRTIDFNKFMFFIRPVLEDSEEHSLTKPLLNITLIQANEYENNTEQRKHLNLMSCRDMVFGDINNLNFQDQFSQMNLSSYLCPNHSQNFTLQGIQTSDLYQYLQIKIEKCSNYTLCYSEDELIDILHDHPDKVIKLYMGFTNSYMNLQTSKLQPFLYQTFFLAQLIGAYTRIDISLTETIYNEDIAIIPYLNRTIANKFYGVQSQDIKIQSVLSKNSDQTVADIFISLNQIQYLINKSYDKLDVYLAYVGGILQTVIFMLSFLVGYYNMFGFYVSLANKLYTFDIKPNTEPLDLTSISQRIQSRISNLKAVVWKLVRNRSKYPGLAKQSSLVMNPVSPRNITDKTQAPETPILNFQELAVPADILNPYMSDRDKFDYDDIYQQVGQDPIANEVFQSAYKVRKQNSFKSEFVDGQLTLSNQPIIQSSEQENTRSPKWKDTSNYHQRKNATLEIFDRQKTKPLLDIPKIEEIQQSQDVSSPSPSNPSKAGNSSLRHLNDFVLERDSQTIPKSLSFKDRLETTGQRESLVRFDQSPSQTKSSRQKEEEALKLKMVQSLIKFKVKKKEQSAQEQQKSDFLRATTGYQSKKEFLQKSIEDVMKYSRRIKMSALYFLSWLCCKKYLMRINEKVNLIDRAVRMLKRDTDIASILYKLQDIDKLKKIILTKDQNMLFNYTPKPIVTVTKTKQNLISQANNELNSTSKRQETIKEIEDDIKFISKQTRKKKSLLSSRNKFESMRSFFKLYNAYDSLYHQNIQGISKSDLRINSKLMHLIGEELRGVFEASYLIEEPEDQKQKEKKEKHKHKDKDKDKESQDQETPAQRVKEKRRNAVVKQDDIIQIKEREEREERDDREENDDKDEK